MYLRLERQRTAENEEISYTKEISLISEGETKSQIDLLLNQTHGNMELFALYNNDRKAFFISKYFKITRKPAFATPLATLAKTNKNHLTLSIIYTK